MEGLVGMFTSTDEYLTHSVMTHFDPVNMIISDNILGTLVLNICPLILILSVSYCIAATTHCTALHLNVLSLQLLIKY